MATAAASISKLVNEQRIVRVSFRLSDTLKDKLERSAKTIGISLSDYLVHLAAMEKIVQEECGETLSDNEIPQLRKALDILEAETEQLTALQKLFIIGRLTRVQMIVLAGKTRRTA